MVHTYNKYEMISLHALETHTCCRNSIVAPIECIDVLIALGHMLCDHAQLCHSTAQDGTVAHMY